MLPHKGNDESPRDSVLVSGSCFGEVAVQVSDGVGLSNTKATGAGVISCVAVAGNGVELGLISGVLEGTIVGVAVSKLEI